MSKPEFKLEIDEQTGMFIYDSKKMPFNTEPFQGRFFFTEKAQELKTKEFTGTKYRYRVGDGLMTRECVSVPDWFFDYSNLERAIDNCEELKSSARMMPFLLYLIHEGYVEYRSELTIANERQRQRMASYGDYADAW